MNPQGAQAALAVLTSLTTALGADDALQGILATPGVYTGRAPRGAAMPYIVIDDIQASRLPAFGGGRGQGTNRLKLWASDSVRVLEMYVRVQAVLDDQKLALEGFEMSSGRTEFVTAFPDPSDDVAIQGVVNYEWKAQVVAA